MHTPIAPVVLHPGKDKPARRYHPWIFSGAVKSCPDFTDGDILPVTSSGGDVLGHAYFNHHSGIMGRFVSFGADDPHATIRQNIKNAIALRASLFDSTTTAYRLVNAEGDSLPGLVVDRYADVLVVQISTWGMERLKTMVTDILVEELHPRALYEKSNLPSRKEENLPDRAGWLAGTPVSTVEVSEYGIKYLVPIEDSQKTGLFLDQREMRSLVKHYGAGRTVLNCFSYTGGFGVSALMGGALRVDNVDISLSAKQGAQRNIALNGFGEDVSSCIDADVFQFLRELKKGAYDFIILDPPAFAKRRTDTVAAARGYKDINRLALQAVSARGLVLTCSCSHFVDDKLFRQVLFEAAAEAGRQVRIIGKHILAPDHPINIYHPESEYLKSYLLFVQ